VKAHILGASIVATCSELVDIAPKTRVSAWREIAAVRKKRTMSTKYI
jgi:hypothetical protein